MSENARRPSTYDPPLPGDPEALLAHILVVDDECPLAEEIVECLQGLGWRAETVSSGADALARIDNDLSINVMLTDIRMPVMDGFTLARTASGRRGDEHPLSIIIFTGHATLLSATETVRLGAVDFLSKPLTLVGLKSSLSRAYSKALHRRTAWLSAQAKSVKSKEDAHTISALKCIIARSDAHTSNVSDDDDGRSAFLSVVNHELRTPLVPILGLAELIEMEHETLPRKDILEFAREIRRGGERLTNALTRIAEFTELSAGRVKAEPRPLLTTKILAHVAATVATQLQKRKQTLSILDAVQSVIVSDGRILHRALVELVMNASQFSPYKTEIILSATEIATGIALVIADEGSGMTELETGVAMRPFQQIDMSLTRQVEGLGLGLALVRKCSECLGGYISFESRPGIGTHAILHLPNTAPSHCVPEA